MTRPLLAILLVCGCGPSGPGPDHAETDRLAPHRLYPLSAGNVWSYDVDLGLEGEPPALAITRVQSVEGSRITVSSGPDQNEWVEYELRPEGIFRVASGNWLLRAPIERGAEWPSGSGRTARVTSVTESVETPAGDFTGCVKVEETGDEAGRDIMTVYCPDVGPVFVQSGMRSRLSGMTARVVARLRGYMFADE